MVLIEAGRSLVDQFLESARLLGAELVVCLLYTSDAADN